MLDSFGKAVEWGETLMLWVSLMQDFWTWDLDQHFSCMRVKD